MDILDKPDISFLIDAVKYTEPTEQEIKMLEGTKNVKDFIEAEAEEEPVIFNERKMFIDMIKVIALIECGHKALDNPSNFYNKEKQLVISTMGKLLDLPIESIKEKFNNICDKHIFMPTADFSQLPIIRQ
jgi:hypothetical protein